MRIFNFDEQLIPLDEWIQTAVDWTVLNYREFFPGDQGAGRAQPGGLWNGFSPTLPPFVVILLFAIAAWRYAGKRVTVFTVLSFLLVGYLGLWDDTMTTLAMVICSVVFCAVVGHSLSVSWRDAAIVLRCSCARFLDAMQTTPAFVYLIPVVMLFSIGTVSGILATIVFALPPIIRLTSLGIRQVHPELVEAALAFGATPWQVLRKVQIPLLPCRPSWPGLNQTIMMALSMVVIAALIGAGGLGNPVVQGLNTLEIGLATIGGLSIVLLAMVLDRITQGMSQK